jgi:hypothetical protein
MEQQIGGRVAVVVPEELVGMEVIPAQQEVVVLEVLERFGRIPLQQQSQPPWA